MYFYEVLVADQAFHGKEPLTYNSDTELEPGVVVLVPLQRKLVVGLVIKKVNKPFFVTRPIARQVTATPLPAVSLQLLDWLRNYYPAPLGIITQQFLPSGLKQVPRSSAKSKSALLNLKNLPPLTREQRQVIETITHGRDSSFLLHGDTGTGKTRVYMELALRQLKGGRSVLILTPEIGLTPQLVNQFQLAFKQQVFVVHSHLTASQKRDVWLQILHSKKPIIVVGPRSALFSPIHKLGLIVIDEAHETAYKQEQAPYYQTIRVAGKLAQLHQSLLIQGSATPLISEYYIAQAKKIPVLRMRELPAGQNTTNTHILINLRDKDHFSRRGYLSNELLDHIQMALNKGEQALVFLNRRGTARLVLCSLCGWQALCPICDLPLTYHGDSHSTRCHTCGFKQAVVPNCPVCSSPDIVFKSIGTKAIADDLKRQFSKARIQRFDTDNLKVERLEQQYEDVLAGKVDILVGTQLLAKGLDLPKLAVVGVVIADTSLYFPDYTAEERTYQLLTQVIGRVGRGHRHGVTVVQTYHPDSPAIKAALDGDWQRFYKQQLKERHAFLFPPFWHVLKLTIMRANQKTAIAAAEDLITKLRKADSTIQIVGPSPSFHEKIRNRYRWQILVKSKRREALLKIIPLLPANWSYDLDPTNLL